MGREVLRVPADWEHPRYTEETAPRPDRVGDYRPIHMNRDFDSEADEWERDLNLWRSGEDPKRAEHKDQRFWEWHGAPPDRDYYRSRAWTDDEATHFQVYETVSEGTPVTPHFATEAELVDYLVANGDFWDQKRRKSGPGWSRKAAESFVKGGWAPSMVVVSTPQQTVIHEPRDGSPGASS